MLAWSFGPLFVRGVDATATTKVFFRLWMAQPAMITLAYLTGGRINKAVLRSAL